MYTLYYSPSACSLATHVILHELNQAVEIKNVQQIENFMSINPVGAVPVLIDQGDTFTEGAAIVLHLLNKHNNTLLPTAGDARQVAIENLMFANATMHPSYGRLFFIAQHISDEQVKKTAFNTAAQLINQLWKVVEDKLNIQGNTQVFLGGEKPSAADILLTVYSRWGENFPVEITIGPKSQAMIEGVLGLASFQKALAAE